MAEASSNNRLERELQAAKLQGRWLSDEEHADLEQQHQQQLEDERRSTNQRNKLLVLTVVCALLPPLWPLAFGLTLYLLFPKTITRVGFVAGIALVTLGILITVVLALLTVWLLSLLT